MSDFTLPRAAHTMPAGSKVCHRTFGPGRVLPAPTRGRGDALVEFESGVVSVVTAEDLVALPPEGFVPKFEDSRLSHYEGPAIVGGGVEVARDWDPEAGMLYWIAPSDRRRGDEFFTEDEIRALVAALQGALAEG